MCPGIRRGPGNGIRGVIIYTCLAGLAVSARILEQDGIGTGVQRDHWILWWKRGEGDWTGRKEGEMFIKYSSCSVNTAHTPWGFSFRKKKHI